jgi:hypothetical protein
VRSFSARGAPARRNEPVSRSAPVDLFASEPFDFTDVYARALRVPLEKTEATVISAPDLITLKRRARRAQDVADIEALEDLAKG